MQHPRSWTAEGLCVGSMVWEYNEKQEIDDVKATHSSRVDNMSILTVSV